MSRTKFLWSASAPGCRKFVTDMTEQEVFQELRPFVNINISHTSTDCLPQVPTAPDVRHAESSVYLRDIKCAKANKLEFGIFAALAIIKWSKSLCRECGGEWAIGNSLFSSPCISRLCEHITMWNCTCSTEGPEEPRQADSITRLNWPRIENGTIMNATTVPPRRLICLRTQRVVPFYGTVSKLCRQCFNKVSCHKCIQK